MHDTDAALRSPVVRRLLRRAVTGLLLLAAAVLPYLALRPAPPTPHPEPMPTAATPTAPIAEPLPAAARTAPRQASAASAARATVKAADAHRQRPGGAELCGLGTVPASADGAPDEHRIPPGVRTLAAQRLGLAMASSPDERVRAAELLLRVRLAMEPGAQARLAEEDAACRRAQSSGLVETSAYCADHLAQSEAALRQPAAAAIDQLARLAAVTADPIVYALAFEACHGGGLSFRQDEGNCQLVTAARWAQIDPGNAVPWLHRAAQALAQGDAPAADAAMAQAARAGSSEAHTGALAGLVAAAMPPGMPLLEQTAVQAALGEVQDIPPAPYRDTVLEYCTGAAALAEARRPTCDALAQTLATRASAAADASAGVELGERLGWPADRTSALVQQQRRALDAALRFRSRAEPLGCEGLQRSRELALLAWRRGELGAGRELLRREASGRGTVSGDGRVRPPSLSPSAAGGGASGS